MKSLPYSTAASKNAEPLPVALETLPKRP